MAAEGLHPVDGVLPGPADAVVLALAHIVQRVGSLGAQFIDGRVVAAFAVVVLPARAGTEGQALDGGELQEEVGLEPVAFVVAVLAGVIDLRQRVRHLGAEVPLVGHDVLVLVPAAFVIVGREERAHRQERTDVVVVDAADGQAVAVADGEGDVLTELQDVAAALADQGEVRIHPEGLPVELRRGRIADGTGLGEVRETDGETGDVAAAEDVDGLVVDRGVVDRGLLEPVGTVPGTVLDLCVLLGDEFRPVILGGTLDVVGLVVDFHVLLGIQRRDPVGVRILPAVVGIHGHADLAGLALLGGHEDDAVRGASAVDGAGSRILEDVDGLDVVRGEGLDAAARNTVNDVQRRRGTGGTHTADGHLVAFARLTGVLDDGHAGGLALQGAEGIDRIHGGEFVAGDIDGGTGDEALALRTITDDDRLVQFGGGFHQGHVIDVPSGSDGELLGLEAERLHVDGRTIRDGEHVVSFAVRDDAVRGAHMRDTGSDDRITVGVDDRTGNPLVLSHHDDTAQGEQRHRQEMFETHKVDKLVVINGLLVENPSFRFCHLYKNRNVFQFLQ